VSTSRRAARLLMLTVVVVVLAGLLTVAGDSKCYCVSAPDSASVCMGSDVMFQVTANGDGPLTYQWYHGSEPLSDNQRVSGTTAAELRISGVESRDAGGYNVVVTGPGGGVTSSVATLTVKALTAIGDQPDPLSLCPGGDAIFSVAATGEGTLTYQWHRGSTPLTDGGRVSGAATSQLTVTDVEAGDAGPYAVTVTGECGAVASSPATLTIMAPTLIGDQPDLLSLCPGVDAVFSVAATGEGKLSYQWYRGSTRLTDGGRVSGATMSQLTIAGVESDDAGDYQTTVTGKCGAVTSSPATLTIKAPTVINDQPDPLSLCPGADAVFSVAATGEGNLTYQWHRGSTPLTDGGRVSGATSPRLTITSVESSDAGDYKATAAGECGELTSDGATLTVKAPTVISDQPDALEVYTGADVTFSVAASGEGTLTYQWFHNSTPLADGGRISGATTPQLTIADVEIGDAGDYTVAVTGECGALTSDVATLSVHPSVGKVEIVLAAGLPKDVLIVLDITGSMEEPVQGGKKIDLAKAALRQFLSKVPGSMEVGLRTFHHCEQSVLEVPIQPVSTGRVLAAVENLKTGGTTPLAYALRQIPGDLQGLEGPHVILFITDGAETCEGDPLAAAKELATSGLNIIFHLVGFNLSAVGKQARASVMAIANAAGGRYVDVESGEQLLAALGMILPPTYRVFDSTGKLVKEGIVGEAPFELPTGTYSVVVTSDSKELLRKDITVELHETVTVTVTVPN